MMHPGLPPGWAALVGVAVVVLSLRTLVALRKPTIEPQVRRAAHSAPGTIMRHVTALAPWLLLLLKIALVALFLLIVTVGPFWHADSRAKSGDGADLEYLVGRVDSDNLFCWFILVRSLPLGYLGWVAGPAPARAQSFHKQQPQPACA